MLRTKNLCRHTFRDEDFSRPPKWQSGKHQVRVGYGNDTFLKVHAAEVEAEKGNGAVEKVLPGLHNTFAMVIMESGVPALILFTWMFA